MLANVQSRHKKLDKLMGKCEVPEKNRACLLGLWNMAQRTTPLFQSGDFGGLYCLERDGTVMGKLLDGGLCLSVYKSLCNTVMLGKHCVHLTLNLYM